MSRMSDILATEVITHHCTEPGCPKCRARARWHRRRAWRTRKNPAHTATRRGDAT
jgi:hypothetical protein